VYFLPSFDSQGPVAPGGSLPEGGGGGGHFSLRCGQMLVSAEVRPLGLGFRVKMFARDRRTGLGVASPG
jgi:hypothetical protein